jgi:hypothetical protein
MRTHTARERGRERLFGLVVFQGRFTDQGEGEGRKYNYLVDHVGEGGYDGRVRHVPLAEFVGA